MYLFPALILIVLSLAAFTPVASASMASQEMPIIPVRYDIASDPLLFIWAFGVEHNKAAVTANGELTGDEKKLARWKNKQSHLWAKLQTGQRLTINASAYTAAADECGKNDGITASGLKVTKDRTLACPPNYPFGAKIAIEGLGEFRCEDRGGAIKGNHFDIYVETKSEAFAFGRRHLQAEIVD